MERGRTRLSVWMLIAASLFVPPQRLLAQGLLSILGESVRTPSAPSQPSADESTSSRKSGKRWHLSDSEYKHDDDDSDDWFGFVLVGGAVAGVTAPIWMPIEIARDDYSSAGYFTTLVLTRILCQTICNVTVRGRISCATTLPNTYSTNCRKCF